MVINTPFQKRYVLSPSVFTSSHPTEVRGSQAHFQLSIMPKSTSRNTPDKYQEGIFRMFAQPFVYFLRHIIHIKALFHKRFVRCS